MDQPLNAEEKYSLRSGMRKHQLASTVMTWKISWYPKIFGNGSGRSIPKMTPPMRYTMPPRMKRSAFEMDTLRRMMFMNGIIDAPCSMYITRSKYVCRFCMRMIFMIPAMEIVQVVSRMYFVYGPMGTRVSATDVWVPEINRKIDMWSSLWKRNRVFSLFHEVTWYVLLTPNSTSWDRRYIRMPVLPLLQMQHTP